VTPPVPFLVSSTRTGERDVNVEASGGAATGAGSAYACGTPTMRPVATIAGRTVRSIRFMIIPSETGPDPDKTCRP
jgi:hypothetical protein